MKNLYLLLITILFLSCSASDNGTSSDSAFHPPSWIQGTWGLEATQYMAEQPLYRFTSDDVCQLSAFSSICWKEEIEFLPEIYSGNDSSSDTTYETNFIHGGGVAITLKFERVSATKILWVNTGTGDAELSKLD